MSPVSPQGTEQIFSPMHGCLLGSSEIKPGSINCHSEPGWAPKVSFSDIHTRCLWPVQREAPTLTEMLTQSTFTLDM